MKRNYFFIIVAIALLCLFFIFFSLWWEIESPLKKDASLSVVPRSPYKGYISGVGVVEPSSNNVYIGTPLNRQVSKVFIKVGDKVKKGDILFQLEDRDLQANLAAQQAAYKSAFAKLKRLKAFPRPEDISEAEAALKNSKLELDLAKNQYEMVQRLPDPRAISEEEKKRRYYNYQQAEAKSQQAQAQYEKVKAGTWKPDLEIARFEVQQAEANVNNIKAEIERTVVRSPIDGTVLQVNIHAGEIPSMDSSRAPLMIIGNVDELFLRVSINQLDISHFQPIEPATAYFQGDSRVHFPLEFVRIEPYLVNKQNLTNDINEKVDTRVLQIIYRIKKDGHPIYVGQQMDVFIQSSQVTHP